jgi:LacI family transcriptional regulator
VATIRDVAKLSGYSVATVSRAMNKSGYINTETEKKIIKAMDALNFQPSVTARSLAGKSSSTIALIIPDILNPFFPEVARAIEDAAHQLGYTVILCNSDNDIQKEKNYFDVLISKKIDGIIIASYSLHPEHILNLKKKSVPVVVIDNQFAHHSILSFISKNREGGRMAATHLLEQGCRKIGHICGPLHLQVSSDRSLGYEDVCFGKEWFIPSLIVQSGFHVDGGYKAMIELLSRHPDIDGVFAGNDLMAIGALKALYEMGRQVPADVKLIGFDGIALNTAVPELSTIAQPIYEIGTMAMGHLYKLMKGEVVAEQVHELDVKLVARQSSASIEKENIKIGEEV